MLRLIGVKPARSLNSRTQVEALQNIPALNVVQIQQRLPVAMQHIERDETGLRSVSADQSPPECREVGMAVAVEADDLPIEHNVEIQCPSRRDDLRELLAAVPPRAGPQTNVVAVNT